MKPTFCLPSLAELNGQAQPVSTLTPSAFPYEDMVELRHVDLLLRQVAPLLRAYLLGGWDVYEVLLGIEPKAAEATSMDAPPDSWLRVDLATLAVDVVDEALDLEASWKQAKLSRLGLGFRMKARTNYSNGKPFHMDLGYSHPEWKMGAIAAGGYWSLLTWSAEPRPERTSDINRLLDPAITAATNDAVLALTAFWEGTKPTPDNQSGLLWLFNPEYWTPEPETRLDVPGSTMIAAATEALGLLNEETIISFLRNQVPGDEATLADVLVPAYKRRIQAKHAARDAFRDIEDRGDRLGGLLDQEVRSELRRLPWLEVILHMVHAGVFQPPALPPSFDYEDGQDEEPLQATFVAEDGSEDEIQLLVVPANQTVLLERVTPNLHEAPARWATWEYFEDHPSGRPCLVIVAGPGVRITPPETGPAGWTLDIIRVQDPSVIPERGERINTELLLTPFAIGESNVEGKPAVLLIKPRRDGVTLRHPSDPEEEDFWELDLSVDKWSPEQRYSFSIEEARSQNSEARLLTATVLVVITGNVEVRFRGAWGYGVDDTGTSRIRHGVDMPGTAQILQGELSKVPPPGFYFHIPIQIVDVVPGTSVYKLDESKQTTLYQGEFFDFFTMAVDTGVGFIPIVGDAVDAAELLQAVWTGKDRWGRPLTRLDWVLMTAGVLVPVVSGALLKGLGRRVISEGAPVMFRRGSADVIGEALLPVAGVSAKTGERMLDKARNWGTLPDAERKEVLDWFKSVALAAGEGHALEQINLEHLLNDADSFKSQELQAAYRRWKGAMERSGSRGDAVSPRKWIEKSSGRTAVLARALLGDSLRSISTVAVPSKQRTRWACIAGKVFRGGESVEQIVTQLKSRDKIRSVVFDVFKRPDLTDEYTDLIEQLLKRLAQPDNKLDAAKAKNFWATWKIAPGRARLCRTSRNWSKCLSRECRLPRMRLSWADAR